MSTKHKIQENIIEKTASEWKEAKSLYNHAKELYEQAVENLLDAVGRDDFEGYNVKVESLERKGSVDYKKIPELNGVNLEVYREKPVTYFKIMPSVEY